MEIKERVSKVALEFTIPTYIADDGTVVELTDEDLIKKINAKALEIIKDKVLDRKGYCKKLDRKHEFMTFVPNCTDLVYDEDNKETYEHFIHYYLKNYYVDSNNSRHYTNGGNWQHFKYDVELGLHNRMLSGEFEATNPLDLGVRDLIIIHLMSGQGVRMYGTGEHYKRVRRLKNIEDQKTFWKWVFDSKMIDPNDKVTMSPRMEQVLGNKEARREAHEYKEWFKHYQTFGQLIVNKCWRDGSLEVLKWIVDEYNLDLVKSDELHVVDANVDFSNSLLYSIINEIHDSRIHDTYNNGILDRLYTYEKKLRPKAERESDWRNKAFDKFVEFVKFINQKWPSLKLASSTNFVNHQNTIVEYNDLEDCMRRNILKDELRNYYKIEKKGELESAEALISALLGKKKVKKATKVKEVA